jgi:microcystin-dependent protein
MKNNGNSVLSNRSIKRSAAIVGAGVVAAALLTSAVVWSQSSVSCAEPNWPAELFCFNPDTPARSNEVNANFRTLAVQGPPVGAILPYAGNTEPEGWLFCDGQSVSTATYPELFAALGYRYGGSGSSFSLPNLQDRYVIGAADMSAALTNSVVGSNTANHSHTITANHTHGEGTLGAHVAVAWDGFYWYYKKNDTELTAATSAGETWTATFSTNGMAGWGWGDAGTYPRTRVSGSTGGAHSSGTTTTNINNRPASYSMKYIIRY